VDAVQCAVEIQKELKIKNTELPEIVGWSFGSVLILEISLRMESRFWRWSQYCSKIGEPIRAGGICISGTAFDHVKNKLNLGYKYLGEQIVKNILEPVRVYRFLWSRSSWQGDRREKGQTKTMADDHYGFGNRVIVVIAAIVIGTLYPPAPQPEVAPKEKITVVHLRNLQ